ncbi:DUF892 family protein [Flavobacterium terrigena]|uniref:Ferritin-like metal-binding protein YciE n=1 Tax=Flavobacterium terrigena TaxID=402734 RepID=A0A1H6Q9Q4_9FLAO|nr:DUF892 family protein [Flavobacterium terrigena]SEI40518.1 Ferritin-like metal-binding protein YciE [Flavobacterium terrigena]
METNTKITTLVQLLNHELVTLLGIEQKLMEFLPVWIDKTHNLMLKNSLRDYLYRVTHHADNLKNYLSSEIEEDFNKNEFFLSYYLSEVNWRLENCSSEILDAYLLSSIQTVNHIKISNYGTVATWSQLLELNDISLKLHDASINEKHIDEKLSLLAQRDINIKAKIPLALMQ